MGVYASIKSFSHFKKISNYLDGIIIGGSFSSNSDVIKDEEMILLIEEALKLNKKVIINILALETNDTLILLEEYLKKFIQYDVFYLYGDLGVHMLLKKYHIEDRGIYDPKTMITNSYDLELYLSNKMNACSLSNEITINDTLKILNKNNNVFLKVFGYHQMFYSKRHLISTYASFLNKEINIDNNNSYLKEETRSDLYHIEENNNGTILYRPYMISYLKELEVIQKAKYIYLDSKFIDEDIFNIVLKNYYEALNKTISLTEALDNIKELKLNIKDGFMYNDTVYVKEELK